jgi:hypothetical protein
MIAIDGLVVKDGMKLFGTALSMMFAAYFCLNIHYPVGAAATLEFIQR